MPVVNAFNLLVKALLDAWETAKGERTFRQMHCMQDVEDGYRLVVSNGCQVTVYCSESCYHLRYSAWWALPRHWHFFRVFSVCGKGTPESVQARFKRELHVSCLLHAWASSEERKKAAIDAYVDLLLGIH